jgi:type 1 glutamine amidotransferase
MQALGAIIVCRVQYTEAALKTGIALGFVVFLAACSARESLGDLGESSGGSKSGSVLPTNEAGAPAQAPTGEASAGGAGLAGPDEGTGGVSDGPSNNPVGAYAPRSGPFKMVVYSRTLGFRHDSAIVAGRTLLQQIADEQAFELVVTEENTFLADLDSIEVVFFLNTSGDVFDEDEQQLFEAWMALGGAFVGTHSATETETDWAFYSEVTGQYLDSHGPSGQAGTLELEPSMLDHPALQGLPNPWLRTEEWYRFDQHASWSTKPGFQILMRTAIEGDPSDGHPAAWVREWENFRSFYTALSHEAATYQDALFKKHLTGGIMWAARRDHLLE